MIVKEIHVEAKKSRNFQTYTAGSTILIEDGDNVDEVTRKAQAQCRKRCIDQLKLD